MKVLSIFIKKKKGCRVEEIQEGYLKEDYGLIGDINGGSGNRQVSIATYRVREYLDKATIKGICGHRFYENITIEGLKADELKVGQKILIGDTIQEITSIGKGCFSECNLLISGNPCPLSKEVLFTKVIRGGVIKIGDGVNLMSSPHYRMGLGD